MSNEKSQTDHMTSSRHPLVSVILPVFNGAAYLEEAMESILSQTYEKFEFIIINDGSTDNTASIIKKFNDSRIRAYHQKNQGLANTLNRAVKLAAGEYLARQDSDDISLPQRFEKQVEFLESHLEYGMVGTWAEIWQENRKTNRTHKHPTDSAVLRFDLLFDNPFVHSSVMIRRNVFEKVGFYSAEKVRQPEDYELWSRVAREFEVANIPEILHIYREVQGSICRISENPFLARVVNLSIENLTWFTGKAHPDQKTIDLAALIHGAYHRVSPKPCIG
ncbi:MAG: glycosyltransferase family 2 protein, partial [Thermincolia bacterium]